MSAYLCGTFPAIACADPGQRFEIIQSQRKHLVDDVLVGNHSREQIGLAIPSEYHVE